MSQVPPCTSRNITEPEDFRCFQEDRKRLETWNGIKHCIKDDIKVLDISLFNLLTFSLLWFTDFLHMLFPERLKEKLENFYTLLASVILTITRFSYNITTMNSVLTSLTVTNNRNKLKFPTDCFCCSEINDIRSLWVFINFYHLWLYQLQKLIDNHYSSFCGI